MKGRTKVVNVKHSKYDVLIDRRTAFGNPFIIGKDGTREEVISKYRKWLYKKIQNPDFQRQLLELEGKTLGCHCKPLSCHGDIIINCINYLNKGEKC